MNNNYLIKGLWAGIIISLTIGNIAIIPFGKINYIMMAAVTSVTLILLIIVLAFLVTKNNRRSTQEKVSTPNIRSNYNLSYPSIVNSQVYTGYDKTTLSPKNEQDEPVEFKNTKIYQLPKNSVFTIPNPENGDTKKFFLQEHMSQNDQQFLKKLPN